LFAAWWSGAIPLAIALLSELTLLA